MDNATLIKEFGTKGLRKRSKGVQVQYPQIVESFSRFLGTDRNLLTVGKRDLEAYIDSMEEYNADGTRKLMDGTVRKNVGAVSSFYDYLEYDELIPYNPVPPVVKHHFGNGGGKPQSNGQFRQCITVDQARNLVLNILDPRDRAIIMMLMKTGMRLHELAELNLADVDIPEKTIRVHPTGKRSNRMVFFDNDTVYTLQKWLIRRAKENINNLDALFVDRYGKRLSPTAIRKLLKKYAVIVGLYNPESDRRDLQHRLTPHCLRHSFTTWLGEATEEEEGNIIPGLELVILQFLRGDSGGEAVYRYLHLNPKMIREMYLKKMPALGIF